MRLAQRGANGQTVTQAVVQTHPGFQDGAVNIGAGQQLSKELQLLICAVLGLYADTGKHFAVAGIAQVRAIRSRGLKGYVDMPIDEAV